MAAELTNLEKLRRLPWHLAGNGFNNIFCVFTFFGSVFVLFLSELGLNKTRIGFLLSLMPFCGLLAIFVASWTARFGFKRTFLVFYGCRKFAGAFLLFTPYIFFYHEPETRVNITFYWVAGTVLFFALCRSIAETALYPWSQESIPNYIRGKFGAVNNIVVTLVGMSAMAVAGFVIGHYEGLNRFLVLFGVGTVCGAIAAWCFSFIPGGAPIREQDADLASMRGMLETLHDRNFRTFMIGMGLVNLGFVPLLSFVPLFMKEQVGIPEGTVVYLDIAISLGALLSCYLWGWASDRYGSKPVMITGLLLLVMLPLLLFLMPRRSGATVTAMVLAFYIGLSNMGWGTGFGRYLFVSAVPTSKKTAYMAVFYAWAGLVGGTGPLAAGRLLDYCQGLEGSALVFSLDSFTPFFVLSFLLLAAGMVVMSKVSPDGAIPVRKFMGMFFQGSPLLALESLVRYGRAVDEDARVSLTERMGEAKNPLSANELIEALSDPSFSVRYEAVISLSRLPADPAVVDALLLVLVGNEPDLSLAAAWALGKLGDKSAILPLRETLLSEFELLQCHSARALAKLGDTGSIPYFLRKLRDEPRNKLRLAYAAALGMLRAPEATGDILAFLKIQDDPILRGELTLALARIVGKEGYYIQLWRSTRTEVGTALAQAVLALMKALTDRRIIGEDFIILAQDCAARYSRNELVPATAHLSVLLRKLPGDAVRQPSRIILRECADRLTEFGPSRIEYILLALHVLHEASEHPLTFSGTQP